jgi:hypothetical protein
MIKEKVTIYFQMKDYNETYEVGKPADNTRTVKSIMLAGEDSKFDWVTVTFSDGEAKTFCGLPYVYSLK